MKVRVLVTKIVGFYSVAVYFDLNEYIFLVNRKPRKKYPPSILRKKIESSTCRMAVDLRNEYELEKRINELKLSWPNDEAHTIYYEQEL